jgi:Sucrose synthase
VSIDLMHAVHFAALCTHPNPKFCRFLRVSAETLAAEALTVSGYLEFEEKLDETETDPWTLEVDLAPFNANFPKIQRHDRLRTLSQLAAPRWILVMLEKQALIN